ncbi:hypothetical protein HZ326_12091 [Fusarium oxysporum f. sp. albedinis]|nr:hypothetical protein HZ326_12091 [Fusarium oxysporum f. sp. albedinis]
MGEIPVNKSNATINSMTGLKTLTNSAISVFTLFAANIYQLKSVYLSIRASSRKKPLRILSSHFTPSRMLVWRVWFCLQDSSSTQDLHLECQRGNSGIQWLSGLL